MSPWCSPGRAVVRRVGRIQLLALQLLVDSNYSSARHEVEDENNDGENEQDVNPSTERVTADESYDPEDEKDDCDCPKHFSLS
jgi:hypothetical protein